MSAVAGMSEWKRLLAVSEAEVALREAAEKEEEVNAMSKAERLARQQTTRLAERLAPYGIVPGGAHNEGLLKALEAGKLRRLPRTMGRWERAIVGTVVTFLVSLAASTTVVVAWPHLVKAATKAYAVWAKWQPTTPKVSINLTNLIRIGKALIEAGRSLPGEVIRMAEATPGPFVVVVAGIAAILIAAMVFFSLTSPDRR